jgi:hypothetical protein
MDWQGLEDCAARMHLFPLFVRRALECGGKAIPPAIPQDVRRRWRRRQRELAALMLLLTSENDRLRKRFQSAGLDVLPVKGPTLAETIYGNPLLRDFQDLDYVVLYEEMPAACRVLEECGYAPETYLPESAAFHAAETMMDHHTREIRYLRIAAPSAAPTVVELHWNVFPEAQPALPSQWSREIHALYLAMHGGRHLWQPLKYLCDLRDWLAHHAALPGGFDWTVYFDLARGQRLERLAAAGPALIRQIWGPQTVPVASAEAPDSDLSPCLLRYVLMQREPSANLLTYHRLRLELLDTATQRSGYALRLLRPTPTEWDPSLPGDPWQPWFRRGARLAETAWRVARRAITQS